MIHRPARVTRRDLSEKSQNVNEPRRLPERATRLVFRERVVTPSAYRSIVLAQPAQSLTDLALGIVVMVLAWQLGRAPADRAAHAYWLAAFRWTGVAALCGAVHHGVIVRWDRWAGVSWALISIMVVVGVSYILAAT